jgi:hypothetical protein
VKLWYVNIGVYTEAAILDVYVPIYANSKEDAVAAVARFYPSTHTVYYATDEDPADPIPNLEAITAEHT